MEIDGDETRESRERPEEKAEVLKLKTLEKRLSSRGLAFNFGASDSLGRPQRIGPHTVEQLLDFGYKNCVHEAKTDNKMLWVHLPADLEVWFLKLLEVIDDNYPSITGPDLPDFAASLYSSGGISNKTQQESRFINPPEYSGSVKAVRLPVLDVVRVKKGSTWPGEDQAFCKMDIPKSLDKFRNINLQGERLKKKDLNQIIRQQLKQMEASQSTIIRNGIVKAEPCRAKVQPLVWGDYGAILRLLWNSLLGFTNKDDHSDQHSVLNDDAAHMLYVSNLHILIHKSDKHLWRRPRIIITSFPVRDSIENYEPDRAPNSGREEPRVDQFMDKVFKTFQGAAWDESWLIPNRIISAALQYNDEPFFRGYTIASLFNLKVGDLTMAVAQRWEEFLATTTTNYRETLKELTMEMRLLGELDEILEEIGIIQDVIGTQTRLAKSFLNRDSGHPGQYVLEFEATKKEASTTRAQLEKLLDYRQRRATIEESISTSRQGEFLFVFTIVTVVFTPLAWVAALLALNIEGLPNSPSFTSSYVAKLSGLSLLITVSLIIVPLLGRSMRRHWKEAVAQVQERKATKNENIDEDQEKMQKTNPSGYVGLKISKLRRRGRVSTTQGNV